MNSYCMAVFAGLASFTVAGCGSLSSASSPDITYDTKAEAARQLQIPPDLTDVSNSEQFVLPGTTGGPVARNTLLPQFASVSYERTDGQSWLAFVASPEEVWPQLLAFLRQEKYKIEKTEPASGLIVTEWQAASESAKGSLLKSLVGSDEEYTRLAFRIERAGSEPGSRLFARVQAASEKQVKSASQISWPANSHDPEVTSALLSRFLVFVGIEEQKARGIIDNSQAQAILNDAAIVAGGAGSHLVVHRGFRSSFDRVMSALTALDYKVISSDDGVGRIEVADDESPLVVELSPTHVSEVRVVVTDADGRRLPTDREQALLDALYLQLV